MSSDFNNFKFPWYIFNPRHGMTLNHRTADFLRYFLEKYLRNLRVTHSSEPAPYIYRTMVCAGNLKLGLASFASLAACARRWPKIEMCVDESISPEEVKRFYKNHGIEVDVWTPADLIQRLNANGEILLRRFAETFFWGRKTAFTFGIPESVPILYSDLDVLWFQDPCHELAFKNVDKLLASEDTCFSYNKDFLAILSSQHQKLLLSQPPHCAGLYVVASGFKLPDEVLHYISEKLKITPPGYYYEEVCAIEQTCLGLATKLNGCGISYNNLPTCPDESTLLPSYYQKGWVAAHYAGPTRRQFWRDAWSLLK